MSDFSVLESNIAWENLPFFLSPKQVAQILDDKYETIRLNAEKEIIPFVKVKGHWKIEKWVLRDWIYHPEKYEKIKNKRGDAS